MFAQDASRFAIHHPPLCAHGQNHDDEKAKRDSAWTQSVNGRMRRALPQMCVVHCLIDSVVHIVADCHGFAKAGHHCLAHAFLNGRWDFDKALRAYHCATRTR